MKQILLVVSMLIAAFVAACADSNHSTKLSKSNGGQKTLEQLEKSASSDSLEKLKKQLEAINGVQISDVINAVNGSFGSRTVVETPKEQPTKAKGSVRIQQKLLMQVKEEDALPSKPTVAPESAEVLKNPEATTEDDLKVTMRAQDFTGLDVDMITSDKDQVDVKLTNNTTITRKCIKTCSMEIVVVKVLKDNKVSEVHAYALAWIKKTEAKIVNSKLQNKTLELIQATYEASSKTMNISMLLNKGSTPLTLSANYTYTSSMPETDFDEISGLDSGKIKLMPQSKEKALSVSFTTEDDNIIIKFTNDYGVFGKNKVASTASDVKSSAGATSGPYLYFR